MSFTEAFATVKRSGRFVDQVEERSAEILIIGAGIIGSSVASHLASGGASGVVAFDWDLEGRYSSSELNAGGVRGTWTQELNILSSKLTIDYLAQHSEELGYRACGYLWLHRPERFSKIEKIAELQTRLGWPVETWDIPTLKRRVPLIDKTDDLAGAIYGVRDGLVNPNLFKLHYREKAKRGGALFHHGIWLCSAQFDAKAAYPWVLQTFEIEPGKLTSVVRDQLVESRAEIDGARSVTYRAKKVINCAGAWAGEVARKLGYQSPAYPVRRQISLFDCRDADLTPYGMIIDPTGVYFHPEATLGLSGLAIPDEPRGKNFEYDGESFFMEHIWPALFERSTAFEKLKHVSGWAGLYDVSPDENAILGHVHSSVLPATASGTLYEAHSFSGHGVMHAHAAGLGLSELILENRFQTLDLTPLSGQRFLRGGNESDSSATDSDRETWII